MALEFAHGAIQWLAADVATTVYTVSGLSFQPKALRFYWVGIQSAADAGSSVLHSRRGIGFAASTSERACVATQDQDAVGTSVCTSGRFDDAVASTVTSTPARDGALDLDSITSDGFTLIVDDQVPVNITVFWEAWGGDDIFQVHIEKFFEQSGTGPLNIGSNFAPDVIMLAGVQTVGTGSTSVARDASGLSIGFITNPNALGGQPAANICVTGNADDASASADTDGYCSDQLAGAMIAQAGGNPTGFYTLEPNQTGASVNWVGVNTNLRNCIYMMIKGGSWRTGSYTINGNTGSATATVSGLPFTPKGISLIGRMTVEQAFPTPVSTANDRIGIGTGSSTSSRRSMGHLSVDAPTTMEIDLRIEYDQVLCFPSTTGTLLSAYDINAMNADGFQIIVDVAGGVASEWQGYLAFGDAPPKEPYHPEVHRGPVLAQ